MILCQKESILCHEDALNEFLTMLKYFTIDTSTSRGYQTI